MDTKPVTKGSHKRGPPQVLNKADRVELNACPSAPAAVDFLRSRGLPLAGPSPRLLPLTGPARPPPSRSG